MKQNYDSLIKRIQQFSLTCDIKDENGVMHHFHHGHEYVEIGGMKWATMNVGAEHSIDRGLYFQWGDSKGYTAGQIGYGRDKRWTSHEDYKWHVDNGLRGYEYIKYNHYDRKIVLDVEDDGAAKCWGGNWRTPSNIDFTALKNTTIGTWVKNYKNSGINGFVLKDKNDDSKELFFPTTGYGVDGRVKFPKYFGFYWCNSLYGNGIYSKSFKFRLADVEWNDFSYRHYAQPIRGIIREVIL